MLEGLVTRAQRSLDTLVSKYVTRLAVAVPFVIAVGFGTAAASVKLTELYGNMLAHAVLAGAFVTVGLLAAGLIAFSQSSTAVDGLGNASSATVGLSVADAEATPVAGVTDADPALLLTAFSAIAPAALPAFIRMLVRNLPLVLGVAVLAYLLFAEARKTEPGAAAT